MDRVTRHDLKTDKFVEEVSHLVENVEGHKKQFTTYALVALAVVLIGGGIYFFMQNRKEARQAELSAAVKIYNARVGPADPNNPLITVFPTEDARQKAIQKTFNEFIAKNNGTEDAGIASYLLGTNAADQGQMADAERYLKAAVDQCGKEYGSLAKLALSSVYSAEGKEAESQKLLRDLIDNPTLLVTKGQATLTLARQLSKTNPAEARKLLEPMRTADGGAASRAAVSMLGELAQRQ